jgi:mannitol 2-dehydrogenase
MTTLRNASLPELTIPVPAYDRAAVTAGIVHIGVGGFHRSHEAMYVDRLLAAGECAWGICGIGTQPVDRRMADVLERQDGLYTLLLKHPDGQVEPRVIGSLIDYAYAPDDPDAAVERMAAPTTHIVSLTITEGGYLVDPATGRFAPTEPAVLLDLQPGAAPTTAFGLVTEALVRRRQRGLPPFTVLSCDNVQENGEVAREAFSSFAALRDEQLGSWVREHVAFPSSMVDRITPVTTDDDRRLLAGTFGVDDEWPVVCEPYAQWVLTDDFCDGRPPWEQVGVQLVPDVRPYELMKLRLLNAGHQAIGYLGHLAGYRYTDEVCRDPAFATFLLSYLTDEASPTLAPVPGVDLPSYRRMLLERFGNPHVRDTLARLCVDASDRIPTFLLPVVRAQLASGGEITRSALVVAGWARYAEGVDEQGGPIEVVDRLLETVLAAAQSADPRSFLRDTGVFGELADDERLVAEYLTQLEMLRAVGARAAVAALR